MLKLILKLLILYFNTILLFPSFKSNPNRELLILNVFISLLLQYTFHPLSYGIDVNIVFLSSKVILPSI